MGVFDQLTSQKRAAAVLQRSILADRVSHSWLFCGPSAADLKALALAFAQTLQCTGRDPGTADACMTCKSCLQAKDQNHPDIKVWSHKKPKTFKVDEIRELVADIYIRPYQSDRKVYIVPDANLLTPEGQNALLKTLEEPPEYVVIILLSNSADAMIETIRSRCQTIDLAGDGTDYDPALRSFALNIVKNVAGWDLVRIKAAVREMTEYRLQIESLLDIFTTWYRDILYFKAACREDGLLFADNLYEIRDASGSMSYAGLEAVTRDIRTALLRMKSNVNFELTMEMLLLSMHDHAMDEVLQS